MEENAVSEQQFPVAFGKYLLKELIAVGGMAEVYRATVFGASGFEKEMVVKRILPRYAKNPNFVQMLIDEAKIAVSLSHGNIVPIYELGELEGSYYIAMEYVKGSTVLEILRIAHEQNRPLPWAYAFGLAADVASGLHYAHTQTAPDDRPLGLVHRDINPRNIVVTPAGEVKILDFGIARASTRKHQTQGGVIKGTPGYMSPEQMYGKPIDFRSDIYALGILLHELLTLRRLFPAWTVKEMRSLYEATPIPKPSDAGLVDGGIVDEVLMKALAPELSDRYSSAGEFEEALRGACAKSGTAVTTSGLAREVDKLTQPLSGMPNVRPDTGSQRLVDPISEEAHALPYHKTKPSPVTMVSDPEVQTGESGPIPHTTPMQDQAQATSPMAPFVISLAGEGKVETRPLEPLPRTNVGEQAPQTQILAQNKELEWAEAIGADAELLALARQSAVDPGRTRRTFLIAAGALSLGLLIFGMAFGSQLKNAIDRAIMGDQMKPGAVVIKTRPAGAIVVLDNKERGKTNIKITGIDTEKPHQLLLKPEGRDPLIIEFAPKDFVATDDLPTFFFERDFTKADKDKKLEIEQ